MSDIILAILLLIRWKMKITTVLPNLSSFQRLLYNWITSSWDFFKRDASIQDITIIDVLMQCASFQFWTLYLIYTAIRCFILFNKYIFASFAETAEIKVQKKKKIWRQAQLYLSAKVAGIIVSQIVLVAMGFSTLLWGMCVFTWGGFLAGLSCWAYLKSL